MKNILIFAGSNSSDSINKQLAVYAGSMVENSKSTILDLNDFDLPIYSKDLEAKSGIPENAKKFFEQIKQTDGIVLSLAENNGSYAAVFKNLFDWLSRIDQNTFLGKPMLLMSTSPGGRGGASVLEHARNRFPRHDANIVAEFSLPNFADKFKDGKIIDSEFNDTLKEAIHQFQTNYDMEVRQKDDGKKGAFYVELDGSQEALMTYTHAGPHKIIIDHTEVSDALKGQGVGYKLVEASVNYLRENGLKVIPLCPFAAAVFKKKHDEYGDVLS